MPVLPEMARPTARPAPDIEECLGPGQAQCGFAFRMKVGLALAVSLMRLDAYAQEIGCLVLLPHTRCHHDWTPS